MRKILRTGPHLRLEDIENEIHVIIRICDEGGAYQNIVTLVRDGELRNSRYVFIDMELYAFNLEIHAEKLWAPTGLKRLTLEDGGIAKVDARLWMPYNWAIMIQIAGTIQLIHSLAEIHRNLKPHNGISSSKQV